VRVTHLLCSGDEETEKMHYARKFNERGEADIKLIWEEWFWDSLGFGGAYTSLHDLWCQVDCNMTLSREV
jgi:DNA replication regulator DPB11